VAQLARHPQRPYTLDYAAALCDEFHELHGDRMYADDHAIVGGLARLDGRPVMLIGHQKGRDTKERVRRNYGMPKPEGYRKALRLMKLAERFRMPLVTLIDTPGAYPGVGSEERNQSEAIARNLFEMATLKVPVIAVVIGEGGSGGALAIGVCDRLIMLPVLGVFGDFAEGCASILWKSADKKELAARRWHHRRAPRQARSRRRDRQGTARRRAPRSTVDGQRSEDRDPASPARGRAVAGGAAARAALRAPARAGRVPRRVTRP